MSPSDSTVPCTRGPVAPCLCGQATPAAGAAPPATWGSTHRLSRRQGPLTLVSSCPHGVHGGMQRQGRLLVLSTDQSRVHEEAGVAVWPFSAERVLLHFVPAHSGHRLVVEEEPDFAVRVVLVHDVVARSDPLAAVHHHADKTQGLDLVTGGRGRGPGDTEGLG